MIAYGETMAKAQRERVIKLQHVRDTRWPFHLVAIDASKPSRVCKDILDYLNPANLTDIARHLVHKPGLVLVGCPGDTTLGHMPTCFRVAAMRQEVQIKQLKFGEHGCSCSGQQARSPAVGQQWQS